MKRRHAGMRAHAPTIHCQTERLCAWCNGHRTEGWQAGFSGASVISKTSLHGTVPMRRVTRHPAGSRCGTCACCTLRQAVMSSLYSFIYMLQKPSRTAAEQRGFCYSSCVRCHGQWRFLTESHSQCLCIDSVQTCPATSRPTSACDCSAPCQPLTGCIR